jgi:hypothetical protein
MQDVTGTRDWTALENALAAAGTDEAEFVREAVAVLGATVRRAGSDRPASQLSPSDADVLRAGGFGLEPGRAGDPDIVARTAAHAVVLLAQAKTTADVAVALRVSSARIRQRAQDRSLYAIRDGDEWRFPGWQFDAVTAREIPGLAAVLPSLPATLHPTAVYRFLTEPNPDLEIDDRPASPVTWLASGGDPGPVAEIAAAL